MMLADGYVPHKGYAIKEQTYFCPSNMTSPGWTNYTYNSTLLEHKISKVRSTILLLLDSMAANGNGTWYYFDRWLPWSTVWPVHSQSVNAVFVDGHVELLKALPHVESGVCGELTPEMVSPVE